MLKNGFVFRLQTTDPFLLHLLYAADHSQFAPKIIILTVTAELMAEPLGFKFGAVHEDNADLGVRMDGAEMIGFRIKFICTEKYGAVRPAGAEESRKQVERFSCQYDIRTADEQRYK